MPKAAGGDLGGLRDVIPNAATRRLIFERCAMFSYGKSAGMKALRALMIAFVPVLMVLLAFPELGDQVPMKVNAAGEVLRYGRKGELLFLPVMGFMLSAATVAMGLKQARKYGEDMLTEDLDAIDGVKPIPICAKVEAELSELDPEEAAEFLADLGLERSGLEVLAQAAYKLLGLQSFFTAGEVEVRAWTVRQGATAPQAAGVIHTDFERGFIKAETIAFEDYVALGGEKGAKEAGRLRMEGKDYIMQDGDVVHFRFNV